MLYHNQAATIRIGNVVEKEGLKYWWPLTVKHTGVSATMHARQVFVRCKPLLWFVKGEKLATKEYLADFVDSTPPSKLAHDLEQSVTEARHVIERLTYPNQVVLDCCMGSGTTGEAAICLKRKFVGIESDSVEFSKARIRIAQLDSAMIDSTSQE